MPKTSAPAGTFRGRRAIDRDEFLALTRGGADPGAVMLWRESIGAQGFLKALDGEGEARTLEYVISSDRPDRSRDVVKQEGMDASDYHGVVLWAHDYGSYAPPNPPIGKTLRFRRETGADGVTVTIAAARFAGLEEGYPLAETCYSLARAGFMPDCSIGFEPHSGAWTYDEDRRGFVFEKWSLLEWSLVPIGCNTDAQRLSAMKAYAKQERLDLSPIDAWARGALDAAAGEAVAVVPRAKLEAVVKALGFGRGVKFFDLDAAELRTKVRARVKGEPVADDEAPVAEPPVADPTPPAPAASADPDDEPVVQLAADEPATEPKAADPEDAPEGGNEGDCPDCGGTGEHDGAECPSCGGTGHKAADAPANPAPEPPAAPAAPPEAAAAPDVTVTVGFDAKGVDLVLRAVETLTGRLEALEQRLAAPAPAPAPPTPAAPEPEPLLTLAAEPPAPPATAEPTFRLDPNDLRAAVARGFDDIRDELTALTGRVF